MALKLPCCLAGCALPPCPGADDGLCPGVAGLAPSHSLRSAVSPPSSVAGGDLGSEVVPFLELDWCEAVASRVDAEGSCSSSCCRPSVLPNLAAAICSAGWLCKLVAPFGCARWLRIPVAHRGCASRLRIGVAHCRCALVWTMPKTGDRVSGLGGEPS